MSSNDGLLPSEKAAFGRGRAGAEGSGEFFWKISGVGQRGRRGGSA